MGSNGNRSPAQLRISFSTDALLRTRFAPEPAPLLELDLAIAAVQRRPRDRATRAWQVRLAHRLPPTARPLFGLISPEGNGPMFLDPICPDVDEALATVAASPPEFVQHELEWLWTTGRPPSPWSRDLARRDRGAWECLLTAVRDAHAAAIAPCWDRIVTTCRNDLAFRSWTATTAGWRACLAGLYPGAQWHGDVLHVPSVRDSEIRLDQRSATLMPSAFWTGGPLHSNHPDGSLVLIYPAVTPLPRMDAAGTDAVAKLLGRTRAEVLRATTQARSTSAVATELGISVASVSEHAKTLRAGRLIESVRRGRAVLHACTPLGLELLATGTEHAAVSDL